MNKYNPMLDMVEIPDPGPDWVLDALKDSELDVTKQIEAPKAIIQVVDQVASTHKYKRVFTLGNFSAIIGKAKTKKTYLLSAIVAALMDAGNIRWDKFVGNLYDRKLILYFDTEQGLWDCQNVAKRIITMAGKDAKGEIKMYNLRKHTPEERCKIIEFALMMHGDECLMCVIDGIADLAKAINDEEEATRLVSDLMRWTAEYNIHIATVIHQNKQDNYATGWLGSAIMKKCEIILQVTKDTANPYTSFVECALSRSEDFDKFELSINHDGYPVIGGVDIQPESFEFDVKIRNVPF